MQTLNECLQKHYIDNVDDTLTYGELQKIVEGKQDFKVENDKVCMP